MRVKHQDGTATHNQPWLLIDVSSLAHRVLHTPAGALADGVLYGVLRDVAMLQRDFVTRRTAFAFDAARILRREASAAYKASRDASELSEDELLVRRELRSQLKRLRKEVLPEMGFKNVCHAPGYEADDVLAVLVKEVLRRPGPESCVLVSDDKDLYQLLRANRVRQYHPRKKELVTSLSFRNKYGLAPQDWVNVKALGGCSGDGVAGIPRVAEKTAVKFLTGRLGKGTKAFQAITSQEGLAVRDRNLPLVRLPYAGCPDFALTEDTVTPRDWDKMAKKLGMDSLTGRF